MRVVVALLSLLPIVTWFCFRKKKNDLFSPVNVLTILYIVQITIPILAFCDENVVNSISNNLIRFSVSSSENFTIFVVLSVISYYLVLIGIKLCLKPHISDEIAHRKEQKAINKGVYFRVGVAMWVIGFIAAVVTVVKVGGLHYLMQNQNMRTTMIGDLDFLSWLRPFLSCGIILILYSREKKMSIPFLLFVIVTGLMQGLGARRVMVMLVIEVFFIYHYTIKKINLKNILKIKYIGVVFVIYVLFSFLLFLRGSNVSNSFMQNIRTFGETFNSNVVEMVVDESYIKHHMLTIEYFKDHEYWRGKTFIGLVTSVIPSRIYEDKPPVDDGTYLYSIAKGRSDVEPPMSFKELDVSSLPLETFSSMYANFGVIGVIFGSLLKGVVIGYFYRKMRFYGRRLFPVYAYTIVLFGFELATLNIFQVFYSIAIMFVIIRLIDQFSNKTNRVKTAAEPSFLKK